MYADFITFLFGLEGHPLLVRIVGIVLPVVVVVGTAALAWGYCR